VSPLQIESRTLIIFCIGLTVCDEKLDAITTMPTEPINSATTVIRTDPAPNATAVIRAESRERKRYWGIRILFILFFIFRSFINVILISEILVQKELQFDCLL